MGKLLFSSRLGFVAVKGAFGAELCPLSVFLSVQATINIQRFDQKETTTKKGHEDQCYKLIFR